MPRVALPPNGIHVEAHGAASATVKNDPEGALFATWSAQACRWWRRWTCTATSAGA